MKKKLPLIVIIILLCIAATFANILNTSAIIPKLIRNVNNLTYYRDNTSGTPIQVNSINGASSTPIGSFYFNNNAAFLKPSFNLNQTFQLSKTVHAKISLEITAVFSDDVEMGVYCPQGDYEQGIYVSECLIRDMENHVIAWEGTNTFSFTEIQGTNTGSENINENSSGQRKTYFLDLIIYHNSDNLFTIQSMPFRGRFISWTSSNSNLQGVIWQILYTQNPVAFTYEDTDPIPSIQAQTIAINDNFQDLFDKLDELIDKQSEQEEQEQEDRDNIDNQQTDINDDAAASTQDMQTATTNITGVMSTFLTNLTNLNRNNCTLPEISAYGFSLGQINLCTFRPPSWVANVSSAVVSLMVLGLAVHVFKRIMRIAKGIAGSK